MSSSLNMCFGARDIDGISEFNEGDMAAMVLLTFQ